MSKFSFRSKSGLMHIYDYLENAQISVYYTLDDTGKIIDQLPAHCKTMDTHVKRVMNDFNANSGVISDELFDRGLDSELVIWALNKAKTAHVFKDMPPRFCRAGIPAESPTASNNSQWDILGSLSKYIEFMTKTWQESSVAFFSLIVMTSGILILVIPALVLTVPVLAGIMLVDFLTNR